MNRRERRLQQAEFRRALAKRTTGVQHETHAVLSANSAVPDDIKVDVCRAVRSIQFNGLGGGDCQLRAAIGFTVLRSLGWKPKITFGSMLYRVGPDPVRDVIAYCGPGNAGQMYQGGFLGHIWLELDGEIADFSCGEWPTYHPETLPADRLGPPHWRVTPPTLVWASADLFDWKPDGTPELNEIGYGPWIGEGHTRNIEDILAPVRPMVDLLSDEMDRYRLLARVRALRSGYYDPAAFGASTADTTGSLQNARATR